MNIFLKEVRIAFPALFEAEPFEQGGQPRYSAVFLIEPGSENDKKIRAAIKQVAAESWDKKADAMLKSFEGNSNKFCYLDGNTKDYDGFEGMMYLSAHRREVDGPVTVIDRNRAPLTKTSGKPYGGSYVNASVDIWAQVQNYPGVRCGMLGVQFVKDGDAFGGGRPADPEDFPELGVDDEAAEKLV